MTRIDPNTGTELLDSDYRDAMRGIAFSMLGDPAKHEALAILWAELSDRASHFYSCTQHATSDHMRQFWQSRRRDALDLLGEVEDAYRLVPDCPIRGM